MESKFSKQVLENIEIDALEKFKYISEYDKDIGSYIAVYLTVLALDPHFVYHYPYIYEMLINMTYSTIRYEREKVLNTQPSEN